MLSRKGLAALLGCLDSGSLGLNHRDVRISWTLSNVSWLTIAGCALGTSVTVELNRNFECDLLPWHPVPAYLTLWSMVVMLVALQVFPVELGMPSAFRVLAMSIGVCPWRASPKIRWTRGAFSGSITRMLCSFPPTVTRSFRKPKGALGAV